MQNLSNEEKTELRLLQDSFDEHRIFEYKDRTEFICKEGLKETDFLERNMLENSFSQKGDDIIPETFININLSECYGTPPFERKLIKQKVIDWGGNYVIFFMLSGSPPKGYALYIAGHKKIIFIDAWGKIFKTMDNVEIKDI